MAYGYHPPVPLSASGSVSGSSSGSGLHYFSSPFGDTTYSKVFVGGLAWETRSEMLHRHFEQFGEILEAVVISDKNTGRSKGYGFVTFRLPESASRACANPSPIIDGRRANCNLASLGRPQAAPPYAHARPPVPYVGGMPLPRGPYIGGSTYHQPLPYNYQQAISHPSIGYTAYGSGYPYPQNIYSPFMQHQYVQVYGVPGAVNTAIYLQSQLNQPISTAQGFATMQGYSVPGHHYAQPGGPNINNLTVSPCPSIQAPYPRVLIPVPAQPQFIVPANSSQFVQSNRSDNSAS